MKDIGNIALRCELRVTKKTVAQNEKRIFLFIDIGEVILFFILTLQTLIKDVKNILN